MQLRVRNKLYHIGIHQHRDELPLLVMLHGFMGSGRVFTHLIPKLTDFVNPVTIDLLGHGSTEGDIRPERFAAEEQIEDLKAIIDTFHPDPVFLHGYSMGGRLALQYALAHSGTISGLILESTTSGITAPKLRAERRKLDEERAVAIESDFDRFLDDWIQLPLFNTGFDVPDAYRERYRQVQSSQNPAFMAGSLRGFGTGTMPPAGRHLKNLTLPVLLLTGEADDKYCTIAGEMQQEISNSRTVTVKDAGHRVHVERPEAFVMKLKSFINEMTGP